MCVANDDQLVFEGWLDSILFVGPHPKHNGNQLLLLIMKKICYKNKKKHLCPEAKMD